MRLLKDRETDLHAESCQALSQGNAPWDAACRDPLNSYGQTSYELDEESEQTDS